MIEENVYAQIDEDGYSNALLEAIIDFKKDEAIAVPIQDKYVVTRSGRRRLRKTTSGWKLLVRWRDGHEAWIALKDLKESNPDETAEFAKSKGIDLEPAFAWWVP